MAIINRGKIQDFAFSIHKSGAAAPDDDILALSEAESKQVTVSDFYESSDRRGIALKSLSMNEGFPSFIGKLINLERKFYFLAWAWDMKSISFYPGEITTTDSCIIPLRPDENERKFIGNGAVLFPPRSVRGGIAIRVQIWESSQDARDVGALIKRVSSLVSSSELSDIITAIGVTATGGAAGSFLLAQKAATKLADMIGSELEGSSDELVDYFEGYFSASEVWPAGVQMHRGAGSSISLELFR